MDILPNLVNIFKKESMSICASGRGVYMENITYNKVQWLFFTDIGNVIKSILPSGQIIKCDKVEHHMSRLL